MLNTLKIFVSLLIASSLCGCSASHRELPPDHASVVYSVPVRKLIMENFVTSTPESSGGNPFDMREKWITFVPKYIPEADPQRAYNFFRESVVADGTGDIEIKLTILDVRYLLKTEVIDNIPFLALANFGSAKAMRCSVTVSIGSKTDSKRVTLTHEDDSIPQGEVMSFFPKCRRGISKQLADELVKIKVFHSYSES